MNNTLRLHLKMLILFRKSLRGRADSGNITESKRLWLASCRAKQSDGLRDTGQRPPERRKALNNPVLTEKQTITMAITILRLEMR